MEENFGYWPNKKELSSPASLEPKYFPAKKSVSFLALIQLMLASSHFIESAVILHRNFHDFYDEESRLIVAVIWALTFCWILCTIILLIGLFINLPSLLLPHIIFSVFWLACKLIILFIMLISSTRLPSLLLTCTICAVIIVSIPYEWTCYQTMRVLL